MNQAVEPQRCRASGVSFLLSQKNLLDKVPVLMIPNVFQICAQATTMHRGGTGANGSKRIQEFLWTGHKAVDLAIPGRADAPLLITPEKQAGWERERAHRFWETSSHEAAAAAASLAATGVPLRAPG
jgi:hypothetical protein